MSKSLEVQNRNLTGLKKIRAIPSNWVAIPAFFFINWSIISTPIVGDDLINPFDLYRQTNGSLIEVIKFSLDWGVYVHVAPIGMLTGGLWNYLWVTSQEIIGLGHQDFYIMTKVLVYILFIITLQRVVKTLLPRDFKRRGIIEALSVLSVTALVQIHGLWSNDPVTNYPLAGTLSSIIGAWCIINFIELMDRYTRFKFYIASLTLLISSLWYEMNLGLLIVLPVYYVIKKITLRNQGVKPPLGVTRFIGMIGLPLIIYLSLRIANLDAASKYDGTTFKLGIDSVQTWFLLNMSWIPFANLYTANHFNIPLNVQTSPVYVFQTILLITIASYLIKNLKTKSRFKEPLNLNRIDLLQKMLPFILYAFSATASHSLTPKYQNEIRILGQVYMSYSGVLLVASAFLCILILMSKTKALILFFCGIAIANLALNTSISNTFNSSMERNNRLIEAFENGNMQERCDALEKWKVINWPDYYREGMELGLKYTFRENQNVSFCLD